MGEEGELLNVRTLIWCWNGVEVIGDEVQRNARFVILGVEEVLEILRLRSGDGQGHADELRVGIDLAHGLDRGVIDGRVSFRSSLVFKFRLVQNLPVGDRIMEAGIMALAEFVSETTLGVPGEQASKVFARFFTAGIAELGALLVVPDRFVRVSGVVDGLVGLVHPLRKGAEVQDDGMAFGCLQKIHCHGINQRKVPRGLAVSGWFQFGNTKPRIRQPRHVANVVGLGILERLKSLVMDGGSATQQRIHDHL